MNKMIGSWIFFTDVFPFPPPIDPVKKQPPSFHCQFHCQFGRPRFISETYFYESKTGLLGAGRASCSNVHDLQT